MYPQEWICDYLYPQPHHAQLVEPALTRECDARPSGENPLTRPWILPGDWRSRLLDFPFPAYKYVK